MSQKISTTILPKLTPMASDLTLKGLFAMNAPDVPDWFVIDKIGECPDKYSDKYSSSSMGRVVISNKYDYDFDKWDRTNKERRFTKWLEYYSELMIKHFSK